MASGSKKNANRVEPSFDTPKNQNDGRSDMRLDAQDRIADTPRKKRRTAKNKSRKKRSFFGRAFYWLLVFCLWGGIATAGMLVYFAAKMPPTTDWEIPSRPPNIKILDIHGEMIANRGTTGGEAVSLSAISPFIPKAVIAIEDRRFYSHFGIDPIGLARALVTNITSGRAVQGGSTLTQQLAKNLFLSPDRTIERKVQEVMLALWLEHKYTKDQILEMYLNRVYLGSGAYGVDAAARRYFGKSAKDVDLREAATLAGLLKAPSRLSPARDPEAAAERSKLVLAAMRDQGMIDTMDETVAAAEPPTKAASYWQGSENYAADKVIVALKPLIGDVTGDIVVQTTIDMQLQKTAEKAIRTQIEDDGKKMNVTQGALVSLDATGAIRALVGGYDYAASQFNRATDAKRQPASTFKPFVYLSALEQGRTPDSIRNDAPVRIGKWTPSNDNGKYLGPVTLATALSHSLNSVSAQLVMEVGPQAVIDTAHRLGIRSPLVSNASLALGTSEVGLLELTDAYVPFANGGYSAPAYLIEKITDSDGTLLYQHSGSVGERVLNERELGMMNAMLSRTVEDGTAKAAQFGWPAAGKTGTGQNFRDAWFIGYTANLTTGVWFGNDDGDPMKRVFGSTLPVRAWKNFMSAAHKGVAIASLPGSYELHNVLAGGSDNMTGDDIFAPAYDPQSPAGEGDDGYWPPAPETPKNNNNSISGIIDQSQPDAAQPAHGKAKSTTLMDIIMGNDQ